MSHGAADETLVERLARPAVALDLLAVVAYAVVSVVALSQSAVYGTPLAVALGLPLLLFAPGYGLVSALFPGATPETADDATPETAEDVALGTAENATSETADGPGLVEVRRRGLSTTGRAALGFGVSLALLPVVGLALELSPLAITPTTVLLSVAAATVAFAAVGAFRRLRRPADRRFSLPLDEWADDVRRAVSGESFADRALSVGLAVAVVASVGVMGYAVAVPGPDQNYTNISLLTQNETGALVAEDYPRNFSAGESKPLVVELTNHRNGRTKYSVVAELQRVEQADDGGAKVLQDRRLATFTPAVDAGRTWRTVHEVTPTMTGEDLRLVYLVYRGEPPEDPSASNAYDHVHVWVNVSA